MFSFITTTSTSSSSSSSSALPGQPEKPGKPGKPRRVGNAGKEGKGKEGKEGQGQGIHALPVELIEDILSQLAWSSIASFSLTSRHFNQTILSSTRLQYKRCLFLAGLIDNPRSCHSIRERLQMVKERETRWLRLDESRGNGDDNGNGSENGSGSGRVRVEVPADVGTSYELEDGVFLITAQEETDSASVLTVDVRNVGAKRTKATKKEEEKDMEKDMEVWGRFALMQNVINFIVALDDNDLFAFATKREPGSTSSPLDIRLLQYSTRLPHTSAISPTLETGYEYAQDEFYPDLMLSGEFLVVSLRNPIHFDRIIVQLWDWKMGDKVWETESDTSGVVFLTRDVFIMPDSGLDGSLSELWVFRIVRDEEDDLLGVQTTVRRVLSLCLPPQSRHVQRQVLECRSHPRRYGPFVPSTTTSVANDHAFFEDPSRSVVQVLIKALLDDDAETIIMASLIIHRQAILSLVAQHHSPSEREWDDGIGECTKRLGWADWGPKMTRVFPLDVWLNPFVSSLSGSRMVCLQPRNFPSEKGQGPRMLHVLDFDPLRVRRALSQRHSDSGVGVGTGYEKEFDISLSKAHVELFDSDSPTTIYASEMKLFDGDVSTFLPYIRSTLLSMSKEDRTTHVAPRKRDRVSNWMSDKLLAVAGKSSSKAWKRQAHCRWDTVLVDSTCLIGLKIGRGPDEPYTPTELEVLHFG